jgi:hypothetical protein
MVNCHYGVLTDGVFNSSDGSGYATSGPVQVDSLPPGASAIVHVKKKSIRGLPRAHDLYRRQTKTRCARCFISNSNSNLLIYATFCKIAT